MPPRAAHEALRIDIEKVRGLTVNVTGRVTVGPWNSTQTGNPSRGVARCAISSENGRSAYLVKSPKMDTT